MPITTDFAGTETAAVTKTRLTAILEAYGYDPSSYSTWGDARTDLNVLLTPSSQSVIAATELAGTFRPKLNYLNEGVLNYFVDTFEPSLLFWRAENAGTVNRDGTGATATGTDLVGRIIDLSGNNNHASAPADSNRSQLNSTGWVFSGVDDYYSLLNAINITENMTVVRAFKRASAEIKNIGLGRIAVNNPTDGIWFTDNRTYPALGYTQGGDIGISTATGSFVQTVIRNASTETIRRNAASVGSRTSAAAGGPLSAFGITNVHYNSGEISFLAVFPYELTEAELAVVEQIAAATNGATLA